MIRLFVLVGLLMLIFGTALFVHRARWVLTFDGRPCGSFILDDGRVVRAQAAGEGEPWTWEFLCMISEVRGCDRRLRVPGGF